MRTCSMCFSNLRVPKLELQSSSLGLTSLGRRATITTISQPLLKCYRSIQYSDAPVKILDNEFLKHFVKVFSLDLETTGLFSEGRIVEIAVRDLHGGKNSCFQTLVNPEQHVPNSHIHGITTNMVTHSGVLRMAELIPILVEYIKSRQVPGGHVILTAHNARCFDVPFLLKEFSCCSFDVPLDWLFLDTLALARELRKLHGKSYKCRKEEKRKERTQFLLQD
ncbi:unnamed protein product [Prunus armeniaca]|uniref:Exonuclease domain-containing protein n=1 Tax=Prunus armeniaca TaxID=36596 RepID=A0A6J5VZN8_PRUAR|nr:unnamed protein product [Prunus armeniaca]